MERGRKRQSRFVGAFLFLALETFFLLEACFLGLFVPEPLTLEPLAPPTFAPEPFFRAATAFSRNGKG